MLRGCLITLAIGFVIIIAVIAISPEPQIVEVMGTREPSEPSGNGDAKASMPRVKVIRITATPARQLTPATSPRRPTATPTSTSTRPPQPKTFGAIYVVANTDGEGVYIRRSPDMDDRLKAWPDDTAMVEIAGTVEAGGRYWRNVRDPDGNEGFIPSEYLLSEKLVVATVTQQALVSKRAATSAARATTPRPTTVHRIFATQTAKARIGAALTKTIAARNTCTAATRTYIQGVEKRAVAWLQAFNELTSVMGTMAANPSLLANDRAVFVVKQRLLVASRVSNELAGTRPRDAAAMRVYEHLDRFSRYFAVAASTLIGGLEDLDQDAYMRGAREADEAFAELNAGLELAEDLCR